MNIGKTHNKTFTILEGVNLTPNSKDCTKTFYAPSVRESVLVLLRGKDEAGISDTFNFSDGNKNGYSLVQVAEILSIPLLDSLGVAKTQNVLVSDIKTVVCRWTNENQSNVRFKDCFGDSFIGLRYSCNYTEPTSGLFVNDLPSVSLKKFAAAADAETQRGENLFKQKHDAAIDKVLLDIESGLSKDYSFHHVIEQKKIGRIGRNFSGNDTTKGFTVKRHVDDIYQVGKIESISFKSDAATNAVVYIDTAEGTWSKPIRVKKGRNDIVVNFESSEDEIKVWIDGCFNIADEIESCGCSSSCDSCSIYCGCFYVQRFEVKADGTESVTGENGIMVRGICKATIQPLICQFTNDLKYPAQYQIGIGLMKEVEVSGNTHPLCRNSKDDAKMLIKRWEGISNEYTGEKVTGEYWTYLKPVIRKMKKYLDSTHIAAFECEDNVTYIETIG